MSNRTKPINVEVSEDNHNQLLAVKRKRKVSFGIVVDDALTKYFSGESLDGEVGRLYNRIDDLKEQNALLDMQLKVVAELLTTFAFVYMSNTPEIPPDEIENYRNRGKKRYEMYLQKVAQQLADDQGELANVTDSVLESVREELKTTLAEKETV